MTLCLKDDLLNYAVEQSGIRRTPSTPITPPDLPESGIFPGLIGEQNMRTAIADMEPVEPDELDQYQGNNVGDFVSVAKAELGLPIMTVTGGKVQEVKLEEKEEEEGEEEEDAKELQRRLEKRKQERREREEREKAAVEAKLRSRDSPLLLAPLLVLLIILISLLLGFLSPALSLGPLATGLTFSILFLTGAATLYTQTTGARDKRHI